ncbi:MAG: hypothetical protein JNM78_17500 [Cyclobacteriaceae bacterium]|nr:hypothetical protein [Cyclobacteriaceae bacterium]
MANFNAHQIKEINDLIEEIAKVIKPKSEIGAHDKPAITQLLKTHEPKKKATFFKCKREFTESIVMHFVKEKEIAKSRFHKNNQTCIFILK